MEFIMLLIQTGVVLLLMSWLLTGVLENLFQPRINSEFTAEVLDMARMRETYPCLLYTSPSPRDVEEYRMPSSA